MLYFHSKIEKMSLLLKDLVITDVTNVLSRVLVSFSKLLVNFFYNEKDFDT